MYKIKEPDFEFSDNRGSLIQLVHEGYNQINVLISKKGVERGGHYHKISREAFYVIDGSVEVKFSSDGQASETHIFNTGDFFEIEPLVVHSMFFPEDCTMIAMYDICVEKDDGTKDIYAV